MRAVSAARRRAEATIAREPRRRHAPGRAAGTLADLATACGDDRQAALCRELTKLHEETWRGSLGELAARAAAEPPRGEVTIVIAVSTDPAGAAPTMSIDAAHAEVDRLVGEGMSRSSAAREMAHRTGLPRRDLFRS